MRRRRALRRPGPPSLPRTRRDHGGGGRASGARDARMGGRSSRCVLESRPCPASRAHSRAPTRQEGQGPPLAGASAPPLSPARRCPRSLDPQPRPSERRRVWRSCCLRGPRLCLPRVPRKAPRSSHSETVSLNARDLEAVAAVLSCPGNRSDHAHGSLRHGRALATAGPLVGLFGETVQQICAMRAMEKRDVERVMDAQPKHALVQARKTRRLLRGLRGE